MKSDIVNGTVSSFFLMNQWTAKDWIHKEIDIEFLGKNLHAVQLTTHLINTKTNSWQNASVTIPLPFSIDQDYHDFCILWTPDSVVWFADKQLLHVEKKFVPDEPMQMLMNHWNADASATGTITWLGGVINPNELPSVVSYNRITVQTLNQYLGSLNSIHELKSAKVRIFPNPAKQSVNVAFDSTCRKIGIELLNAIGQKVYTKQFNGTSNNDEKLDIAYLQKGIYLIKVSTDDGIITEKLIKE
jgi:beta-glucanase (GH16 family)